MVSVPPTRTNALLAKFHLFIISQNFATCPLLAAKETIIEYLIFPTFEMKMEWEKESEY